MKKRRKTHLEDYLHEPPNREDLDLFAIAKSQLKVILDAVAGYNQLANVLTQRGFIHTFRHGGCGRVLGNGMSPLEVAGYCNEGGMMTVENSKFLDEAMEEGKVVGGFEEVG